jgi:hypothetical protein
LPSFTSAIQTVTSNGTVSYSTVSPFLVPRQIVNQAGTATTIYSEDMYSVDHSHTGYINDLHSDQATRSVPQNDGYPLDQEGLYYDTRQLRVRARRSTAPRPTLRPPARSRCKPSRRARS